MKDLLLTLSAIITIAAIVPYIKDIIQGKTKPNITSWITWTLLFIVATIAEYAAGEYRTAIFTASITVETLLVVILGLKHGYAKYTKFDVACQIGALAGFLVWWIFNNPLAAVVLVVLIDLIAAIPTVRHGWVEPNEETWLTFALSGLGGVFAILALTSFSWTSLIYPVYIVVINTLVSGVIIFRQGRPTNKLAS